MKSICRIISISAPVVQLSLLRCNLSVWLFYQLIFWVLWVESCRCLSHLKTTNVLNFCKKFVFKSNRWCLLSFKLLFKQCFLILKLKLIIHLQGLGSQPNFCFSPLVAFEFWLLKFWCRLRLNLSQKFNVYLWNLVSCPSCCHSSFLFVCYSRLKRYTMRTLPLFKLRLLISLN